MKGKKRHLLVNTEGLVLEARSTARRSWTTRVSRRSSDAPTGRTRASSIRGWMAATGERQGQGLDGEGFGWSAELAWRLSKPAPEEALRLWAKPWDEESVKVDGDHQLPLRGWRVLLSRWVMERTLS